MHVPCLPCRAHCPVCLQCACSGLYDPTLGPVEQSATCVTCFLPYKDCPGHLGHVVLSVPVYQPLLFNVMFRVLRAKCFCCHRCVRVGARAWRHR